MKMKKLYERPSVNVIAMEMEQKMMAGSDTWNTTGDEYNPGVNIKDGNPSGNDPTDLRPHNTQSSYENWAKPNSVWE